MEDKIYEDVNEGVLRHVGSRHRILDVGCGTGTLGFEMKKRGNIVWGLDVSERAIKLARDKLDKVFICDVADLENLPVKGEEFDVIVFADILEHLDEPGKVLREYQKYLKENGHVIVSLPNIASWTIRAKRLFGPLKPAKYGILDETHKHFYDLAGAKKLVWDAGYKIEKTDVNPNILRAAIPPLRRIQSLLSGKEEETEFNKKLIESRAYLAYREIVLPIENFTANLWKSMLSFQLVFVAKFS
ncbi:MAG: class I SAM-dependent methyltransferase [Candidatus Altiarchaeota archaeon]